MIAEISEKISAFTQNLTLAEDKFHKDAFVRLGNQDFPTTKDEYWKYTRLAKLTKNSFVKDADPDRLNLTKYIISNDYLVVVNGFIREDLSQFSKLDFDIDFLGVDRMTDYTDFNSRVPNDVFTNINSAYLEKVTNIRIGENKINEGPLQIIYVSRGKDVIANNRLYIHAGKSSQSEIILTFVSLDAENCFTNQITEVMVEENAHLTINKLQVEENTNFHISTEQIFQHQNSNFKINTITLSGLLVRNNINIQVAGENCETHMNGAVITKDSQHIDNHTFVDHQVPNCFSNENYKYVLGDQSTGVFNGRVIVRKDAQKINAYQNNGNILLSEKATINSKPELEIYADDVKCSHGSTTGQLDEQAVFYLQSRGISKPTAKRMLVQAFIGEVLEAVENDKFIELVDQKLEDVHNWKM
ncbi:Fe-S cluster assembly protein SufD [Paracrocinitomix mangrovi]|uniref:Fe-S cluster assembly protein SufD n=1 Tax=Paracrocinitomix mangrovi TaxID=2862509 RepID=UPI001C8DEE19|nr:Fe-S cluster assembly protein SufD [Paracrocinitomix mangrovi]UKN03598.1 Fe-S cluster assembly protein SufD [Paracrocinitomix mangrovi]